VTRHHTSSLALAVLVWCTCTASALAQSRPARVVETPQGITVNVENAGLGDLLAELARLDPRITIHLDPSERNIPVTVAVENGSVADAIFQVVKASGLDFVMNGRGLWAGRAKKAAETAGTLLKESTQPEPPDMAIASDANGAILGPVTPEPNADNFGDKVFAPIVPITGRDENLRVDLPNFVPFKLRPEAIKARRAIDITIIP
jgi:hypothetical protein